MDQEEEQVMWQEVLDELAAGRRGPHRCPFCRRAELVVEHDEIRTRLECPSCRRFIEGQMRNA